MAFMSRNPRMRDFAQRQYNAIGQLPPRMQRRFEPMRQQLARIYGFGGDTTVSAEQEGAAPMALGASQPRMQREVTSKILLGN